LVLPTFPFHLPTFPIGFGERDFPDFPDFSLADFSNRVYLTLSLADALAEFGERDFPDFPLADFCRLLENFGSFSKKFLQNLN